MRSTGRVIMLFIFCAVLSCKNNENKNIDPFYTEMGEWDSARIPLLKPYEAVIVTKEHGWIINLEGFDGDTGFSNVKKANVIDSNILVYAVNTYLHGSDNIKEAWYVIIPTKHIEKGFGKHQEYLDYLNTIGFKNEPKLHDIDAVAEYYEHHEIIDWKAID
jgi:hypothetical protein